MLRSLRSAGKRRGLYYATNEDGPPHQSASAGSPQSLLGTGQDGKGRGGARVLGQPSILGPASL